MNLCSPEDRFSSYDKLHCWQYDIRLNNINNDIIESGIPIDVISNLKISDFTFEGYDTEGHPNTDKKIVKQKKLLFKPIYNEVKEFIIKHEWLGTMPHYPTHFFIARYNGVLAGVVIMDMPNTFTKLVGNNTRYMERLISRGACISWSPKGLASSLLMWSIRWMVKNTRYRIFTAYSDPEALELGTIYQACNFFYLGQSSGASKKYQIKSGKWVSDRYFRCRSIYKKIAKELDIVWNKDWQDGDKIIWNEIPQEYETLIKQRSKEVMLELPSRTIATKHKYCYVLGKNIKETKMLLKLFVEKNPKLFKKVDNKLLADSNFKYITEDGYYLRRIDYPKKRGE